MSFFARMHNPIAAARTSIAKGEALPKHINSWDEAFAEAHKRTQADDSNRRSAGASAMTHDEYKANWNRHLDDIKAECMGLAVSARSTAPDFLSDGNGSNETSNPASITNTASGPYSTGQSGGNGNTKTVQARDGGTAPKTVKRQTPPNNRTSVKKVWPSNAPLDLTNPFHIGRIV